MGQSSTRIELDPAGGGRRVRCGTIAETEEDGIDLSPSPVPRTTAATVSTSSTKIPRSAPQISDCIVTYLYVIMVIVIYYIILPFETSQVKIRMSTIFQIILMGTCCAFWQGWCGGRGTDSARSPLTWMGIYEVRGGERVGELDKDVGMTAQCRVRCPALG